ncbi:ybl110 [Escherichia coli]|uniref:Ybl110 n=1 Tax=Escherichia coli TaxID=562 RepID=A0A2X1LS84_ECOLX|nr:ybl110 [Escherichia coli]
MQTRAVGAEVQTVSATGGAVRQALANNLQPFAIFFQINAGEVRGFRTFVAVDLFVIFFGAPIIIS